MQSYREAASTERQPRSEENGKSLEASVKRPLGLAVARGSCVGLDLGKEGGARVGQLSQHGSVLGVASAGRETIVAAAKASVGVIVAEFRHKTGADSRGAGRVHDGVRRANAACVTDVRSLESELSGIVDDAQHQVGLSLSHGLLGGPVNVAVARAPGQSPRQAASQLEKNASNYRIRLPFQQETFLPECTCECAGRTRPFRA